MKHLSKFVKTTFVGGMLVLFPLFGCIYLIGLIGSLITSTLRPFLGFLPENRFVNVPFVEIVSVLLMLLMCFGVGVFVKTRPGLALITKLSQALDVIPLYRMLRRIGGVLFDQEDPRGTPVLVQTDSTKQIGFMIEQIDVDEFAVYLPSAPTPLSGSIKIFKRDNIEVLHVRTGDVARMLGAFGVGSKAIIEQHIAKKANK